MEQKTQKSNFFTELLSLPNDSPKKTLFVAMMLCLVCSILVAISAVALKPLQIANKEADIKKNILAVTGLLSDDTNVNEAFKRFEVKVADLETGLYADVDPSTYDQRKAAKDPARNIELTAEQDLANINKRAKLATVYLLKENDHIKQIVLPVHGYGLWSTLYGFISFESDLNTIGGLQFYAHAETPGLGGEVDNPSWREQWKGKKAFDQQDKVKIKLIRGHVDYTAAGAEHQIDGLSGATLTSNGVSNLVNYWLGDHGFGPYIHKIRAEIGQ
jgi:Na+-transporting NADH:ubiquinone oxidoreductase subunit C